MPLIDDSIYMCPPFPLFSISFPPKLIGFRPLVTSTFLEILELIGYDDILKLSWERSHDGWEKILVKGN